MLIGIITGLGISLVLFSSVFLGYKLGNKPKEKTKTAEEIETLRLKEEGISNILSYDYSTALGKRKWLNE